MSDTINQIKESQKTIVAFVSGLLIGALLVWVFSAPEGKPKEERSKDNVEAPNTPEAPAADGAKSPAKADVKIGNGAIVVADQAAGESVKLDKVTYPSKEGWIGVRESVNGKLAGLLGASRYNTEEGLLPEVVELLRSTAAGSEYAVVFYSDNGDRVFSLANDVQVDGVVSTFTAK